jgi:hypothetical protein
VAEIAYHAIPNRSDAQKRLVEHVRMLFFDENLRDPLPFGQLNTLGLPYETYKLALTDELLATVFGDKLTEDIRRDLGDETLSGYLSGTDLAARFPGADTEGEFWIRSGIAGFAPNAADHFYLPERYTDPFGNETTLIFDPLDLFIAMSTDPAGNITRIAGFDPDGPSAPIPGFDYRVLALREIEDINGNRSEVMFDGLGLPTAMAVGSDRRRQPRRLQR